MSGDKRGHTRVGMRLPTRPPADTPRTRVRTAMVALRSVAVRSTGKAALLAALPAAQALARRGIALLAANDSAGGRLVTRLCRAVDLAAHVFGPLLAVDVARLADDVGALVDELTQAEWDAHALRRDLADERERVARYRAAMTASAGERLEIDERFEEPTRNRPLSPDDKVVVDDLDVPTFRVVRG